MLHPNVRTLDAGSLRVQTHISPSPQSNALGPEGSQADSLQTSGMSA